jgi:hypothetical protein
LLASVPVSSVAVENVRPLGCLTVWEAGILPHRIGENASCVVDVERRRIGRTHREPPQRSATSNVR